MYSEDMGMSRRKFLSLSTAAGVGLVNYRTSSDAKAESSGHGKNYIRLAACQILTYPDLEKSVQKIVQWMKLASEDGVDVVVFPEACLCGYQCDESYWKKASPKEFENAELKVAAASKSLDIAVVFGTAHWEDGCLFNSLLAIDKGGTARGRYAKTHLAESWPGLVPGKILPIYNLAGVKSCFIICHDVRYPELVRLPAIAGAQICYFISNESPLTKEHKLSAYRAMPIARATENGIFCVMANAPADPKNINAPNQSHGNSKIIHPDGNVLAEAGYFEEKLVCATINVDEATRNVAHRAAKDDTILKDWINEGARLVQVETQ
jgi:predicted amidohydrolase